MEQQKQIKPIEIAKARYSKEFYKELRNIRKNLGQKSDEDLSQLLRFYSLAKIHLLRRSEQEIKNVYNLNIRFNPALDPYEAVDLFINYPRPGQQVIPYEGLINLFRTKYGEGIFNNFNKLWTELYKTYKYHEAKIYLYKNHAFGEIIPEAFTLDYEAEIHDDNLSLSLEYYRQFITNIFHDLIQTCEEEALEHVIAAQRYYKSAWFLCAESSKALIQRQYRINFQYKAFSDLTILEMLDMLIGGVLTHRDEVLERFCNYIATQASPTTVLKITAAKDVNKRFFTIIHRNFHKLMEAVFLIDPYYTVKFELDKEIHSFDNIASYIFNDDRESRLIEYIDRDSALIESAKFYISSICKTVESLYEKYGESIAEELNSILNQAYYYRLDLIYVTRRELSKASPDWIPETMNFNEFFTLGEFLHFRWQYPSVLHDNQAIFFDTQHINNMVNSLVSTLGPEVETDLRNLYCFMLQLQNLILEYMLHVYYVRTGSRRYAKDTSLDRVVKSSAACFAQ